MWYDTEAAVGEGPYLTVNTLMLPMRQFSTVQGETYPSSLHTLETMKPFADVHTATCVTQYSLLPI